MTDKQISIDLDVYKALEALRTSFEEPYNSILRRALRLDACRSSFGPQLRARHSRTRGEYELVVFGERYQVGSLKEVLSKALLKIEEMRPGFFDKLSRRETSRGRRIVARTPEGIYPGRPQLVSYAQRLNEEWWFDTNISRRGCERYLSIIGDVANIDPPQLI